ncbi:hypothetical protein PHMEG_00041934, partial [Phytophthora megakarya]
ERVDETEQLEAKHKQQQKRTRAKQNVESSVAENAQQSAEILAAQAAVAALKAKKGRKKGSHATEEKATQLQTQAALFARKHALLQQILEHRRLGDQLTEDGKEAKLHFEKALTAIKELEEMAPELLKVEEQNSESIQDKSDSKHHEECKHEGEEHGESCSDEKKSIKPSELPKANDLMAIIKMFYKDVYMGIGACELEENHLAAATDAFKEVLLRDDVHLTAWLKRGEAFERMNAPLLAMLHYNRITNLDSEHDKGKESLERLKTKLLIDGDDTSGKFELM